MKYRKPILQITLLLVAVSVAVLTGPLRANAADLTDANTITERANLAAYYAGKDGRSEARMLIRDKQGREQIRQFTILRRNITSGGDQEFLVFFSRPSDVRGTVYLVKKHPEGDDDRWLYLPGLDLVKRISSGDRRTSFVGSHYLYEDVSGRSIEEDEHSLLDTNEEFYQLKHVPRDPTSVEFSYYITWIDKRNFLPRKIEYFNAEDKMYRTVEALEITDIQEYPTVTRTLVSDLETGGSTEMRFRYIAYDLGLPSDIFEERSLRTPPRNWLTRPQSEQAAQSD